MKSKGRKEKKSLSPALEEHKFKKGRSPWNKGKKGFAKKIANEEEIRILRKTIDEITESRNFWRCISIGIVLGYVAILLLKSM